MYVYKLRSTHKLFKSIVYLLTSHQARFDVGVVEGVAVGAVAGLVAVVSSVDRFPLVRQFLAWKCTVFCHHLVAFLVKLFW